MYFMKSYNNDWLVINIRKMFAQAIFLNRILNVPEYIKIFQRRQLLTFGKNHILYSKNHIQSKMIDI